MILGDFWGKEVITQCVINNVWGFVFFCCELLVIVDDFGGLLA